MIEPQAAAGKTPDCDALVKLCGRTNEHVSRTFRRYFGVTPSAYLNRLRLERAARLLTTGTRPVTEVSILTGFRNLGYFHRCFRDRYGITPRRWRRAHLSAS
jgi:AraC family cel operon transcriptional repressor